MLKTEYALKIKLKRDTMYKAYKFRLYPNKLKLIMDIYIREIEIDFIKRA